MRLIMPRLPSVGLALLLTWGTVCECLAQDKRSSDEPPRVLRLYPAAEADPPLRYRLWPAAALREERSSAVFVNRAVMLSMQAQNDPAKRQAFTDRYNEWSEMELTKLPRDEVRKFLDQYAQTSLRELARAENLMQVDYDLRLDELGAVAMVQTVLPELQEMRQLARLLSLRARLAIAERRWDQAVNDLRLGFRLGEIAAHSTDFLVGRLVGYAISNLMLDAIEEAIQLPDCPSLYWALASLPEEHLFEVRDSVEFESGLITRLMGRQALPDKVIGAEAARAEIRRLAKEVHMIVNYDERSDLTLPSLFSGLYVVAMADDSRDFLATTAWGEDAFKLSAPEAVLRATLLKYSRARDQWVKWGMLPDELWSEYRAERDAAIRATESGDPVLAVINLLTPAVDAAHQASRRLRQTRNLLISIEALRLHAASAGGFPESTERLRPVPCWQDSIARKPFGYQRTSRTTATLTRSPRWANDTDFSLALELLPTERN